MKHGAGLTGDSKGQTFHKNQKSPLKTHLFAHLNKEIN